MIILKYELKRHRKYILGWAIALALCVFVMTPTYYSFMDVSTGDLYETLGTSDFYKGVGASGHSFGGNTAYALCARNEDFVCGINIDGAPFGDYTNDIQNKPFMQISCEANEKAAARVYLNHTKPVYKVLFKDMQHIGFADSKYTMPMKSVVGKLPPDVMHENLCKCHLEFFDAYLKNTKPTPELPTNEAVISSVF